MTETVKDNSDGASRPGLHPLSIAPMIQWTDQHWRYLMRQITTRSLLYTEMVSSDALFYNPSSLASFIGHSHVEYPLALQLGGSDPNKVSEAAFLANCYGQFEEINLNCGCPSSKAKKAGYGAELMLDPQLTRQVVHAMCRKVTNTPITVKCRVGVQPERETYENLVEFVEQCKAGGVRKFILHARNVVLRGLSPAQNRTVPPLKYETVYRLADSYPEMDITINGGITSFDQADEVLTNHKSVRGVMIGRSAYRNPWMFRDADRRFYGGARHDPNVQPRSEVLERYLDYCDQIQSDESSGIWNANTCALVKPLHNFFAGCSVESFFKHTLDEALVAHKQESVRFLVEWVLAKYDVDDEMKVFLES